MPKSDIVIGLDFDNTLVSYDEVMRQTALDLGFMRDDQDVSGKEQVRDFIRSLSSGEIKWQVLQAEVYGKRMSQVCLIDGVKQFLLACKDAHVQTFIVSHKSKHAAQDKEGINLQEVALSWMREQYFFDKKGLGLSEDRVYFEETRGKKVNRIKELACTHFIDDLKEVFLENGFPQTTRQILYSPGCADGVVIESGIKAVCSWDDIYKHFFVNID